MDITGNPKWITANPKWRDLDTDGSGLSDVYVALNATDAGKFILTRSARPTTDAAKEVAALQAELAKLQTRLQALGTTLAKEPKPAAEPRPAAK